MAFNIFKMKYNLDENLFLSIESDAIDLSFMQAKKTETSEDAQSLTYLALGDSYTRESVAQAGRWPNQLAKALELLINQSLHTTIVAKTGCTTDELNQGINEASLDSNYDLISLLIGVNNQYRGWPLEEYKLEFESLLKKEP